MQQTTYDLNTVYRTSDGRDALVVFEGPSDAPNETLRALHRDGAVRIAYLNADGTEPPLMQTEYAWHPGALVASRPLNSGKDS